MIDASLGFSTWSSLCTGFDHSCISLLSTQYQSHDHHAITNASNTQSAIALAALPLQQQQQGCHTLWDLKRARFTPCALPYISAAPLVVVFVILYIGLALRPLWAYRPSWIRPFVEELPDAKPEAQSSTRRRRSFYWTALLSLSLACFVLQMLAAFYDNWNIWSLLPAIAYGLTGIWIAVIRPSVASYQLLAVYTFTLIASLIIVRDKAPITGHERLFNSLEAAFSGLGFMILLAMPLRSPELSSSDIGSQFGESSSELRSPEDNLRLWQYLSVSWMTPLIKKGNSKQLNDEDVWNLPWQFQHSRLHLHFRELKGSVIMRLIRANAIDLCLSTVFATVETAAELIPPVLLQQLLKVMQDDTAPKSAAISYAVMIFAVRSLGAVANVADLWVARRCYERSRGEMMMMLYEKTLNRKIISLDPEQAKKEDEAIPDDEEQQKNLTALQKVTKNIRDFFAGPFRQSKDDDKDDPASTGKILNLMRGDVYEVSQRFWEFSNLFVKPIALIVSVTLVWKIIGWPCLLGVSTVIVAQILNGVLVRYAHYVRTMLRKATDAKLTLSSQFVEAIRHLRWYGWQNSWLDKIMNARQKELAKLIYLDIVYTVIAFCSIYASELFPVVAFYALTVLAGQPLRIDIAFPALQIFSTLQDNLREIPDLIVTMLNAYVAMSRIEAFMKEPDKAEAEELSDADETTRSQPELRNASFNWPGRSKAVLHSITAKFGPGITIVCGKVGSGKSALLQALLGELDKTDGVLVQPDEMVAYCTQTPWLQNMSIRDNILFGYPWEAVRYKAVIDACQLTTDLASFKHGDLSQIGENGIGLSGGQKARVALARAIYSRAKILFLDDPISALDHQTTERLVNECFASDLVKDRTVVLVTHRVDMCRYIASQIIEIEQGKARVLDHNAKDFKAPSTLNGDAAKASSQSNDRTEEMNDAIPEKFIEDETRAEGGVQFRVYWEYVKAGKVRWWVMLVMFFALHRLCSVAQSWFLKEWGEAYDRPTGISIRSLLEDLPNPEVNIRPWLWGFFILATAQGLLYLFSEGFAMVVTFVAARRLFRDVIHRVAHSTFRFYDVTPVGRLMNRLTSDISTIDGKISYHFQNVIWGVIAWISSLAVISSVTPVFSIFAIVITVVFAFTYRRFLPPSQNLRRLEMVSLSPLMSNFGTLIEGLAIVRAYRAQARFQERVIAVVDSFQKMDHFYWSLQAWLLFRFEILGGSSNLVLTLLALWTGVSPGLTAFALVAASKFTSATNTLCRSYGQLQLEFVSVERIVELLFLEQEPEGDLEPPASWPKYTGDIIFEDVSIRYAPHLPLALKNINVTLKGGTSTALLGRTGSGKSTMANSLLATMVPESGRILIDGIDISRVNKQALRSRITFLAQDPVLFPGSLRHNLDPVNEHSDEDCARVLAKVAPNYGWSLDLNIDSGGKNLSQGQRQLIGLARVVLRRSPIVILDEATASIDMETAMTVQKILREEMKESTVVTVAHRLEAVRGAEYCVVLSNAEVLEQGDAEPMLQARRAREGK